MTIVTGPFVGKQLGILLVCWLEVQLGLASRPEGMTWHHLHGADLLCGIGFTMSLLIASLAFKENGEALLGMERLGTLIGSRMSGLVGYGMLRLSLCGGRRGTA